MNKYFKLITWSALTLASVMALVSCESDTWKDHYSVKSDGDGAVASLGQTIANIPEAEKFVQALKSTYMYNGTKRMSLTYWDFLNDNQYLTVWLPDPASITADEWAVYTSTDDDKDHKKVGTEFILNHIARFSHPVGTDTKEHIKMMSDKTYNSRGDLGTFDGIGYKENNILCTNGLLHVLKGRVAYRPNLYDYLTGAYKIKSANGVDYDYTLRNGGLGKWLAKYTKEEIDEERSVQGEVNEKGEIEYIDKVIIRSNAVLKKFGYINVEDSNYILVLPKPEIWDSVYDAVSYYYTYDETDNTLAPVKDSLQQYWTNNALFTDVFFNRNLQKHINDSVTSTQFKWSERMTEKYPYHLFYAPYADGGLFDCIDSIKCSNGVIYVKDSWPYSDSVFRRTIKLEAENTIFADTKSWRTKKRNAMYKVNDSTLKTARVLEITNKESGWMADFAFKNTLRGKYRVKVVFFRNVEEDLRSRVSFRLKFLTKSGLSIFDGRLPRATEDEKYVVGTTEFYPDTVIVGTISSSTSPIIPKYKDRTFDIPYGNYESGYEKLVLSVKQIQGNNLTDKIWLDCIILEPVFE